MNINIRKERKKRGWTQDKLAKLLGVTRLTVANYENGKVIPRVKEPILRKIFLDENPFKNDIFLEKDGIRFSMKEMAVFFVENQDEFLKEPILKLTIDKMVAQKLNDKFQEIILRQSTRR